MSILKGVCGFFAKISWCCSGKCDSGGVKPKTILSDGKEYKIYSLNGLGIDSYPYSLKILAENLLRNGFDVSAILKWKDEKGLVDREIEYKPARVLMQDFTGVPAVVDLAAMRAATKKIGGNVNSINPLVPTHLVIDHSIQVDSYASGDSLAKNTKIEFERNAERYEFLKWGQESFDNFKVVPPGNGICHQVNLEHISKVVWYNNDGFAYPDTLVGTDSHTTMVNGLGVLGWGVGGIEAESVMLGESTPMLIPQVVGFELKGKLNAGITATDLVLTITNILRKKGVVDKFVEFYGEGVKAISLADRATIANMAPEYGATCGIFPVDEKTIEYLRLTGREEKEINLVEKYLKEQGMFGLNENIIFTDTVSLDLSTVVPSLAGPKRPQDRVALTDVKGSFESSFPSAKPNNDSSLLCDGSVVIAAITSCTNTSNPSLLIAAGLLAKKACEYGLKVKPFVKTSLAPGSRVVEEYLNESGLQTYLDQLGFNIVGFGCTTCIGNSGPLKSEFETQIKSQDLTVASVLSGNRNFEGRVHPLVKANYLASPILVIAYALAGNLNVDVAKGVIGKSQDGKDVFLKDILPSDSEVSEYVSKFITRSVFQKRYSVIYDGDSLWQNIKVSKTATYSWNPSSSYIENPPYFTQQSKNSLSNIKARALLVLGDSVTTDHISPAGDISENSPAGEFLKSLGIPKKEFNSYGARRGSHSVMMRGTFANIRIKNEMADGKEGGYSKDIETGEIISVYELATRLQSKQIDSVVIAGKEYGTGSSRDWAAKGTYLLGVRAVIAESFERIHRSNLIGMGVLPFVFAEGETRKTIGITGNEEFIINGVDGLFPKCVLDLLIKYPDGTVKTAKITSKVNTAKELEYIKFGGIMHYVLNKLAKV